MYNGYLLKINGTTLPNRYIDRTSWKCTPKARRVVDSFYDVVGVFHEYKAGHKRTNISFTLREHSEAEHSAIVAFLAEKENLVVHYFNDQTELYNEGLFEMDNVEFRQKKTFDGTVWYDSTPVKLSEY